jgi:putative ABC transport system permease protein
MFTPPFNENEFASTTARLHPELIQMVGVVEAMSFWNKFNDFGRVAEVPIPMNGYFADPNFFKFFDFELKYGNPETVLSEPYSIVLTEKTSRKLFKENNPIGKTIEFRDYGNFTVTGLIKDNQYRSHMSFDLIASGLTMKKIKSLSYLEDHLNDWENVSATYTYIKLDEETTPELITTQMNNILSDNKRNNENSVSFDLQPLGKINPGKNLNNSLGAIDKKPALLIFVGILLIITASFTYNNLSIAKSFSRAKEVGIRKINGARRYELFGQFILEAVVISIISLLISYQLLNIITPIIKSFDTRIADYLQEGNDPFTYLSFLLFAIFLGILTGSVPAWYISRFEPTIILKGVEKAGKRTKFNLKKSIIVFQFFLSLMLLFTIIVMFKQVEHEKNIDLGFNPKDVINVDLEGLNYQIFRNKISEFSGIKDISASTYIPGIGNGRGVSSTFATYNGSTDSMLIKFIGISPNYLENMEIDLLAGRRFKDISNGKDYGAIINKSLLARLDFKNAGEAFGSTINFDQYGDRTIIGVVDDFIISEIIAGETPLVISSDEKTFNYANIRLHHETNPETFVAYLNKVWKELDPFVPLTYSFYDEEIKRFNAESGKITKFLAIATSLIILIAVLGLLGIVMYDVQSRTKEIGIRKVMGSNVIRVIWTLSSTYLKMIIIAAVIATPVSWFLCNKFLENFKNKVDLHPVWFLTGILFLLFIGAFTSMSQTIRAAMQNPVNTLRHE